jgi:ATP-dependent Clp protease ATP-binding subunit ClpB
MNASTTAPYPILAQYADHLTQQIADGQVVPSVKPEDEVYVLRVIQVLHRRHKDDPILVCADRSRRLAVVHEAVRRILKGDLPNNLTTCIEQVWIFRHDRFFGDEENYDVLRSRMEALMGEMEASKGRISLFVDDLHEVVGTLSERTRYVGRPFTIAHARGEMSFIGTTTLDHYRRYIDTDEFWHLTRHAQAILMG